MIIRIVFIRFKIIINCFEWLLTNRFHKSFHLMNLIHQLMHFYRQ